MFKERGQVYLSRAPSTTVRPYSSHACAARIVERSTGFRRHGDVTRVHAVEHLHERGVGFSRSCLPALVNGTK